MEEIILSQSHDCANNGVKIAFCCHLYNNMFVNFNKNLKRRYIYM